MAAALGGGSPLGLVEVGASAGLLLIPDRYAYDYGAGGRHGDPTSPVQLTCELRGRTPSFLQEKAPLDIGWRAGCDLNPLEARDPADRAWLGACVWADHRARAERLAAALALAATEPASAVHPGDALEVLPRLVAAVPAGLTICIFHTAVAAHFPQEARRAFTALVPALAQDREILWVQAEPDVPPGTPRLRLSVCREGAVRGHHPLGHYHPHGEWLDWTAD
jgi:hypothetical protein